MSAVAWARRHARSVLFLIAILAIGGAFSAFQMPVSLFPQISFPRLRIELSAGERPATQMELLVTRPMEIAVRGVPGVRAIHSTTSRGTTDIIADFDWGTDMTSAMLRVESAVSEAIPQVPSDAAFSVAKMEPTTLYPVTAYSLTSKKETPVELRDLALYELRPLLSTITGVRSVGVQGGKQAEYQVSIKPGRLEALGLSVADVANALAASNVLNAVGRLTDHYQLYLGVADSRFNSIDEIRQVIVKTGASGAVRLGQIANVTLATVPQWVYIAADKQPAVLLNVFQQPGGNTVDINRKVAAKLAAYRSHLPPDVHLKKWYDQSQLVSASEGSVRDAMIIGVIIAGLVLLVFLRSLKISAIAIVAVPLVLGITILILRALNQSFNIMTLGGMAAAIGLIIDDMVVMSEHIIRRLRERKHDAHERSVLAAAREFTQPLAGSSAATIVIFLPLAFLGGVTGAFFNALSITMASALIVSFAMAWLAVPILASGWLDEKDATKEASGRIGLRINAGYRRLMTRLLRRPLWLLAILIPIAVLGYVGYRQVGSGFLPQMDEGGFVLDFVSAPGMSLQETRRLLNQVGAILDADPAVATYSVRAGAQLGGGITEANSGDFFIQLKPFPRPPLSEVMDRIRQAVEAKVPSLDIETFQLMEDIIGDLTAVPEPVDVKLFGNNDQQLLALAPKVAVAIGKVNGIVEVHNGIVVAGNSVNIHIDRAEAALEGMTPDAVSSQVQGYLQGRVATQVRRGIKFIGVRAWVPKQFRDTVGQIGQFLIRAPDGHAFPLQRVATIRIIKGEPQITREDLKRYVAVTARISGRDLGSTIAAVKQVLQKPGLIPENVSYTLGGLYKQQQIAFVGLAKVFVSAFALIFVLLLFLYERFSVVFAIIIAPLLAVLVVFFGLWITGIELNITAIMGMTMILGIVTEIAIFYFTELYELENDLPFEESLIQAGWNRMRPIFLTTLAFILALVPLAMNIGQGAAMLQPLAIAIIFGLLAQMGLVLVIMPVIYYLFCGGGHKRERA
ncbi:MAG TPA: efflux RND transporter permease subunit [Gammaproteobacteria bacterium]|nr:efflux RND transporter permease subunit [Gammaproteobacteria bacterium]